MTIKSPVNPHDSIKDLHSFIHPHPSTLYLEPGGKYFSKVEKSPESGPNFVWVHEGFLATSEFKSYYEKFNITPKPDLLWLQLKDHSVAV